MLKFIFIGIFGLVGVFCRYFIGIYAEKQGFAPFPWGTFIINILGSFLIGIIYVLGTNRDLLSPDLRVGIVVGFLGGFTTFSSYCLESVRLLEEAFYFHALLYFTVSPVLGTIAAFIGMILTKKIMGN